MLRYIETMDLTTSMRMRRLPWLLAGCLALPVQAFDTITPRQLPEMLRSIWGKTKPEMNENSRCAAAFDGHSDPARMVMRCSVYMRMGAEAERRAIGHCEEERARKGVQMPCKIVKE